MMKIIEKKYYPWVVVSLLWVVALLNYMDRQMLSTMQTSMKADIHELNQAEAFGALMAVFLWVYGLVSPFAGMVADKVNRKWLVVGSLFVWSAVTLAMGYATSFNQLYYLRGIMGISEALYIPSALSLLADWHEGKSRSLAIGIHMTGIYMGQAIGGFGAVVAVLWYHRHCLCAGIGSAAARKALAWANAQHCCTKGRAQSQSVEWFRRDIVQLGILGYPLFLCRSESSGMGHEELATHFVCTKLRHSHGRGWPHLHHHHRRLIVFGRYLRRIAIGLVGETPSQGARLHQCHRFGHDYSRIGSFGLRPSSVGHCGCRFAVWRGLRYV